MCIVPVLGFNHGVRGIAKSIVTLICLIGGFAVGVVGMIWLDQKFHAIWTPLLFCSIFAALLGFLPVFKPALRWGYACLVSGVTGTAWMISRPRMHKDLMDSWFRLGPKAAAFVAFLGLIWFLIVLILQQKKPPLFWVCALVLEAALVGYFSSSLGGKSHTVHLLQLLFNFDDATADRLAFTVRKGLHFTFYGLIGLSAFQLVKGSGVAGKAVLLLGLAFALNYASFDELRQSDAADRTSSIMDVALDMSGALTFCGIAYWRSAPRKRLSASPA